MAKAENPRAVAGGNSVAGEQLRAFVERIERLNDEVDALRLDIKEVYAEAKGAGYDTKTLRKVVALMRKDKAERDEEKALLDIYCSALGVFG